MVLGRPTGDRPNGVFVRGSLDLGDGRDAGQAVDVEAAQLDAGREELGAQA